MFIGLIALAANIVVWLLIITNIFNDIRASLILAIVGLISSIIVFVCGYMAFPEFIAFCAQLGL